MNKKYKIVISIFTFLLGCGVSTMAAAYSKASSLESILKSQGYHRTHITINGFLYVKAFINKRPARAIIDTGSSDINVTKGSVRALKLTEFHSGENTSVDMHGRKSFTEAVILPHVVISNIPLGNVSASVLQHVSSGSVMTIVVGRNFLKQHHAIIDVYNKNLYLSNKKLSRLTMNKIQSLLSDQHYQSVPLFSLASGDMVIPLQINDSQPVSLLFDTGTGITLLSQDYVKTLHLQQDEKTRMATIEKMLLNPLNTGFQSNVKLNNVPAQLENFAMLRKYLYVQGIFGLSEMVKTHAVIFVKEGLVFLRSG